MTSTAVNCNGVTFDEWNKQVDKVILSLAGVTASDLADYPSWDLWSDGVTPLEAAEICLIEWNDLPEELFEESE